MIGSYNIKLCRFTAVMRAVFRKPIDDISFW